jgi:hypothetical protein
MTLGGDSLSVRSVRLSPSRVLDSLAQHFGIYWLGEMCAVRVRSGECSRPYAVVATTRHSAHDVVPVAAYLGDEPIAG